MSKLIQKNSSFCQFDKKRFAIIFSILSILFLSVLFRSLMLATFPVKEEGISNLRNRQYLDHIKMPQLRTNILDRNELPLALSTLKTSVAINPKSFSPTKAQIQQIARDFGIKRKRLRSAMKKKSYFAWVKRHISKTNRPSFTKLFRGFFIIPEPSRFYPLGQAISPLLGFVGRDNKGLIGLEQSYDGHLKASINEVQAEKDAKGNPLLSIANPKPSHKSKPRKSIFLTIDSAIQEIAYQELKAGIENANAQKGFAIVLDPYNGDLLAVANYPSFDPNLPHLKTLKNTQNLAFKMQFEPGSIVKPFVIAEALHLGLVSENSILNCEKSGRFKVDRKNYIRDDHPKELLTPSGTLIHSSNICTYKIAMLLGKEKLYQLYKRIGFRTPSHSIVRSTRGSLSDPNFWKPIRFANISFGQGHAVTGIQIARAYAILANGGYYVKDRLLYENQIGFSGEKTQIFSPKIAKNIRISLENVIEEGTGRKAKVKGYSAGGKTGTAEKFDIEQKKYAEDLRIASFAGFAPAEKPKIVVLVVIDEPGIKPYYGGTWAGPVFSKISEKTLKYLSAEPELYTTKK